MSVFVATINVDVQLQGLRRHLPHPPCSPCTFPWHLLPGLTHHNSLHLTLGHLGPLPEIRRRLPVLKVGLLGRGLVQGNVAGSGHGLAGGGGGLGLCDEGSKGLDNLLGRGGVRGRGVGTCTMSVGCGLGRWWWRREECNIARARWSGREDLGWKGGIRTSGP